jgi:Asp-tRNA(Asn)/Glu-tRNA(Gln) amidotransferase A subunit family amidase
MILNHDVVIIGKDLGLLMTYFKILSHQKFEENEENASVRMADNPAEIQTVSFPNTSQECYPTTLTFSLNHAEERKYSLVTMKYKQRQRSNVSKSITAHSS